jgi:hypothetical protein
VNNDDTLLRDRLTAAATFDVVTDPRRIHEGVARRQRRLRRRRRGAGVLCALAVVGLGTAGVVAAMDRDSRGDVSVQAADPPAPAPSTTEAAAHPGWPRFLPAPGWDAVQVEGAATASNIPLGPATRSGDAPWDTVERLEPGDVVLYVSALPTGESPVVDAGFPSGVLPLSLEDAQQTGLERTPDDVYNEAVQMQVNGWNITVWIFYGGAAEPSEGARAAAQDQLARLDVPPR